MECRNLRSKTRLAPQHSSHFFRNDNDGHLDMRLPSSKAVSQHRSINLAISSRGIAALQAIDPAATERFMQTVIPMRGRMIHDKHGNTASKLYDMDGQVGPIIPPSFDPKNRTLRDAVWTISGHC
jgi:hypothetical protein